MNISGDFTNNGVINADCFKRMEGESAPQLLFELSKQMSTVEKELSNLEIGNLQQRSWKEIVLDLFKSKGRKFSFEKKKNVNELTKQLGMTFALLDQLSKKINDKNSSLTDNEKRLLSSQWDLIHDKLSHINKNLYNKKVLATAKRMANLFTNSSISNRINRISKTISYSVITTPPSEEELMNIYAPFVPPQNRELFKKIITNIRRKGEDPIPHLKKYTENCYSLDLHRQPDQSLYTVLLFNASRLTPIQLLEELKKRNAVKEHVPADSPERDSVEEIIAKMAQIEGCLQLIEERHQRTLKEEAKGQSIGINLQGYILKGAPPPLETRLEELQDLCALWEVLLNEKNNEDLLGLSTFLDELHTSKKALSYDELSKHIPQKLAQSGTCKRIRWKTHFEKLFPHLQGEARDALVDSALALKQNENDTFTYFQGISNSLKKKPTSPLFYTFLANLIIAEKVNNSLRNVSVDDAITHAEKIEKALKEWPKGEKSIIVIAIHYLVYDLNHNVEEKLGHIELLQQLMETNKNNRLGSIIFLLGRKLEEKKELDGDVLDFMHFIKSWNDKGVIKTASKVYLESISDKKSSAPDSQPPAAISDKKKDNKDNFDRELNLLYDRCCKHYEQA